jgi:hypothetical protein
MIVTEIWHQPQRPAAICFRFCKLSQPEIMSYLRKLPKVEPVLNQTAESSLFLLFIHQASAAAITHEALFFSFVFTLFQLAGTPSSHAPNNFIPLSLYNPGLKPALRYFIPRKIKVVDSSLFIFLLFLFFILL